MLSYSDDDDDEGGAVEQPATERTRLVLPSTEKPCSSETIRRHWINFSLSFAIIHGAAVTALAFASSMLPGSVLASLSLGTFYGAYALSALVFAHNLVVNRGALTALCFGFSAYIALILGLVLAASLPPLAAAFVVVVASAVGGAGGGCLWVAQTTHYALCSTDARVDFASIFAVTYVTVEGGFKLLIAGSLLFVDSSLSLAITSTAVIAAGTLGLVILRPEARGLSWSVEQKQHHYCDLNALTAVGRAYLTDPRVALLAPLSLAFGFSSAWFTDALAASVSAENGLWAVGLASALAALAAGVAAPCLGFAASVMGRGSTVAIGAASYAAVAVLLITAKQGVGRWAFAAPAFALQGVNRALFEHSAKVIISETFADSPQKTAALASIHVAFGLSATATYSLIPIASFQGAAWAMAGFALLFSTGYYLATRSRRGRR